MQSILSILSIGSSVVIGIYVLVSVIIAVFRKFLALPKSSSTDDSHVLITGGSSGIGLEIAKLYLARGLNVTIVARSPRKLEEAAVSLGGGGKLCTISCDVSSGEQEVETKLKLAVEKFGPVDILINCAGVSFAAEFEQTPQKEFERMLQINVLGTIYPTKYIIPSMKRRRKGKVVLVSSQVAQAAIYGYTGYAASKWALRGFAEALQMEVKPFNISVSVSFPPDTDTPGYQEEMLSKPIITKLLSETGSVFSAGQVASDIVLGVDKRTFAISNGVDGWLLKQLHSGMTPVNNAAEVLSQILSASLCRLLSVFYLFYWDYLVHQQVKQEQKEVPKKGD